MEGDLLPLDAALVTAFNNLVAASTGDGRYPLSYDPSHASGHAAHRSPDLARLLDLFARLPSIKV